MPRFEDRPFYPASKPRSARGGIKAQNARGAFVANWWAKRWIAVLESFDIGSRLQRGRSYARLGQVLSIEIEKGVVSARVQGSRPDPYDIRIEVTQLSPEDWQKVIRMVSAQALFEAKLLAGDMPREIESVFRAQRLSLFPARLSDLKTSCSCPDWSNPCKHIAAVYYLLGEEFDRDPFLIFRMRGMDRDEFTAALAQHRRALDAGSEPPEEEQEPLPVSAEEFWGRRAGAPFTLDAQAPAVNAALPRRLGRFPFWAGERPLIASLDPIYSRASEKGLLKLL
ncbi:MAG TPA: SWIM zinc finger family protein [Bryobacteraceae bacterium]|nr:SWIM zinc finger family protein [Bryobacteraceae bacterium]